ncbi:MAG: hypothetical protein LBB20_03545 [Puniceicoccales bacterium]|jgi:tetratricopeptide (TPR) repeat protein|nr:hypothetical protein [Puniceicoccales bacterium]
MRSWEIRFLEKIDDLCQSEDWIYAKFICLEVLYLNPNCIDARKSLLKIRQYTKPTKKSKIYFQLLIHTVLAVFCAIRIKKRHRELLAELESLLDACPTCQWALRLLSEVAFGFGFAETAIFCIQCIPEKDRNIEDWLLVGESYLDSDDFDMAVEIANRVLQTSPDNARARDLLWQSSVEQSIDVDSKRIRHQRQGFSK